MDVNELRRLAYQVRTPREFPLVRATLTPETYGTTWCLTDILRCGEERGVLLDVLSGLQKSRIVPDLVSPVRVRLRTVQDGHVDLVKVRPEGEAPPRRTDADGVPHHHPEQWVPQSRRIQDGTEVPIASADHMRSAIWLLDSFGWMARAGGKPLRRYANRLARGDDQWKLVEQAFIDMHPDLAPPRFAAARPAETSTATTAATTVSGTTVTTARLVATAVVDKAEERRQRRNAHVRAFRDRAKKAKQDRAATEGASTT